MGTPNCARCKWYRISLAFFALCRAQGDKPPYGVWNSKECKKLYESMEEKANG